MRLRVKVPVIGLVALLLTTSRSSGGSSGPVTTDSSAPNSETAALDTTASDTTGPSTDSAAATGSPIASVGESVVSAPAVLTPGSADAAVLAKDQARGLIPGSLIASTYGLKTTPGDPGWSQDDKETLCEVAFIKENSDSTTPHFTWYVTKTWKQSSQRCTW